MLRWMMLAVVGGLVIIYDVVHRARPEHDGVVEAAGLKEPVQILRNELGVPHIYASSLHELFFAQGYVQAQNRWWQSCPDGS